MHKLEFFEGHSGWFSQSIWIQWSSVGLSHFFLKTNGCTSKQSKCPVTGGLLRERLRKKNNSTWGPTSLIEGLTPRMNSSSCHLIVNHPKRFKWKLYQTHSNHWQSNYSLIKKSKPYPGAQVLNQWTDDIRIVYHIPPSDLVGLGDLHQLSPPTSLPKIVMLLPTRNHRGYLQLRWRRWWHGWLRVPLKKNQQASNYPPGLEPTKSMVLG